mgnify:FL=1
MTIIKLFTDGSAINNGHPSGVASWAVVGKRLNKDDDIIDVFEDSGFLPAPATNNQGELMGIIKALEKARELRDSGDMTPISIYSDSAYCVEGSNSWMHNWKRQGWTRGRKTVKNVKMWQEIYNLYYILKQENVTIIKVAGHAGIDGNERADTLAKKALKEGVHGEKF